MVPLGSSGSSPARSGDSEAPGSWASTGRPEISSGPPLARHIPECSYREFLGHRRPRGKCLVPESGISASRSARVLHADERAGQDGATLARRLNSFDMRGRIDYVRWLRRARSGNRPSVASRDGDDRRNGPPARDGRPADPPAVAASECYSDMFALISRLVTRRPGVVVLTCFALAVALRFAAPAWDQVTKDDNVRFFPPDFPSVIGQIPAGARIPPGCGELAGRAGLRAQGRAADAAGQGLCRRHGRPVLPVRAGRTPSWASRSWTPIASPVIGPRLHRGRRGRSSAGGADDRLAERDLPGQDDADRRRPDHGVGRRRRRTRPPAGLDLAVTGSAVVGHDINTAANESIANTTWTTVILVSSSC